jgi:hypothetical protein
MTNGQYGVLVASIFIIVGSISVFAPDKVRNRVLEANKRQPWANWKVYLAIMTSRAYVPLTRIQGAVSIVIGALLLVFLWLTRGQR